MAVPVPSPRNLVIVLIASVVTTLVTGTLAVRFVWTRLVDADSGEDNSSSAELSVASPAGFRQVASIALGPQLLVRDGFELFLYSQDTRHKELVAKLPHGSLPNCRTFELSDGTVLVSHADSIYALDVRVALASGCHVISFVGEFKGHGLDEGYGYTLRARLVVNIDGPSIVTIKVSASRKESKEHFFMPRAKVERYSEHDAPKGGP